MFSWESLEYEFTSGISLIDGFNHDDQTSEGSGKSSLLNILTWTLYGQTPKKVKIDDVIKNGHKSCTGIITLSNGLQIVRQRNPNRLHILENKQKITGKDAKETQLIINELIGASFEVFCQVAYFSQNGNRQFISANETEKGKILSEIQDLTVFDKARKELTATLKTLEKDIAVQLVTCDRDSREVLNLEMQKEELEQEILEFENTRQLKIAQLNQQIIEKSSLIQSQPLLNKRVIAQHNKQKTLLEDYKNDLNEVNSELKSIKAAFQATQKLHNAQIDALNTEKKHISSLKTQISSLKTAKNCPTCGHPISEVEQKEIDQAIKELETQVEKKTASLPKVGKKPTEQPPKELLKLKDFLQKEIRETQQEIDEVEAQIQAENEQEKRNEKLKGQIEGIKEQIAYLEAQNTASKARKLEDLTLTIQETLEASERESELLRAMQKKQGQLNTLKKGFKEFKNYAFANLLRDLSYKATQMAQELFEVPIQVKFEALPNKSQLTSIDTEIKINNELRPLGLLSGGQYRRVQLATDLALAQIHRQRGTQKLDLFLLDEPFKDLSVVSQEKVVKLLEKLPGSVVLIEHSETVKQIIDQIFYIDYKNGTSTGTLT